MIDEKRLAEIQDNLKGATHGEWFTTVKGNSIKSVTVVDINNRCICSGISPKNGNADFIACAKDDIPYLLETVTELKFQLSEANRRADAAVADLKQSEDDNGKCDYCSHRTRDGGCASIPVPYSLCSKVNRWVWRGVEKGAER